MNRGEIYRSRDRMPERGGKPGFYIVVARQFIVENEDVSTVICAPIYSQILGITTEVLVDGEDGVPRRSAIRCDFLCLMFKSSLVTLISRLSPSRMIELDRALALALDLRMS